MACTRINYWNPVLSQSDLVDNIAIFVITIHLNIILSGHNFFFFCGTSARVQAMASPPFVSNLLVYLLPPTSSVPGANLHIPTAPTHLRLGFLAGLLPPKHPPVTFLGIRESSVLSMCLAH
jgi:hypothetical protein